MTDKITFTPDYGEKAAPSSIIKVIGVGGGGSNAVKHMYSEGIVGVDFLICNTDRGHLESTPVPDKLLLGTGLENISFGSFIIINFRRNARKIGINWKNFSKIFSSIIIIISASIKSDIIQHI